MHNSIKKYLPTTKTTSNENCPKPRLSTSLQPCSNHLSTDDVEIIFPTVKLQVMTANGSQIKLRALLDQDSQVNLITERAPQLLRLTRKRMNAAVTGVGSVSGDCKGCLNLSCKSVYSNYTFETEALIVKKLTNN
ncbi:unnamed protein product [Parnassius mnemosyne]|uniref:Peptidase A2 domain-containing protein n=1 Tax=Parnassius mnemosyne TaxID=213953 RepID=A0AAV1LWK3_9NEOP